MRKISMNKLAVGKSHPNRALVEFSSAELQGALGGGSLISAALRLYVVDSNVGGAAIGVHRLKTGWVESGATYNSANDPNTANNLAEGPLWSMADPDPAQRPFEAAPTAVIGQNSGSGGYVEWPVSADVARFYLGLEDNFGWCVKLEEEAAAGPGKADYASRESAHPPQLV